MSSMKLHQSHLNESIREINRNSWLVSSQFLLTQSSSPSLDKNPVQQACWSDGNGGCFVLATAPLPLPNSIPLAEGSSPVVRVHEVDNQAAVWRAGEAFIKAHHMCYPDVTREHLTLQFLKDKQLNGFKFPEVYFHFEIGSQYFLVASRVPGQLLEEAWPNMNETLRKSYVRKVANVCNQLTSWKHDSICGVDGHQLLERYLVRGNSNAADALSPQQLLKNCTEMCMDVSEFVFYHCDLGPTNILVDISTGSLSIIDWELAGYVPIEWVRTKFRLSAGMDFNYGTEESKKDWRRRVAMQLGEMGYRDVVDAWWSFQNS